MERPYLTDDLCLAALRGWCNAPADFSFSPYQQSDATKAAWRRAIGAALDELERRGLILIVASSSVCESRRDAADEATSRRLVEPDAGVEAASDPFRSRIDPTAAEPRRLTSRLFAFVARFWRGCRTTKHSPLHRLAPIASSAIAIAEAL